MAKEGEDWIKKVLESQEYQIAEIGNECIFAFKENLGVVIEDKDWKDQVKVFKNNIYQMGINGEWHYKKRSQVVNYGYQIKMRDRESKIYRFVVCVYVFSNLFGRRVQPIFFRKFGTIFVINREYFPVWLKSLERTYLGEMALEAPSYYMGGK